MRHFLMVMALSLVVGSAQAADTLFYQPQNADASLSAADWEKLWEKTRDNGVSELIVQWTRLDENDFGGADGWLANALRSAEKEGLDLVLGLAHESDYYEVLPNPRRFPTYWHQLLSRSLKQRERLIEDWRISVKGWYLPQELDDWLFRETETRAELTSQLVSMMGHLSQPLHISAFSGGFLAPERFAEWLSALVDQGAHVWWQGGRGTRTLPPLIREAYESSMPCRIGIVREAFQRTSPPEEVFAAKPMPFESAASCHEVAVFSLRYRPWAQTFLTHSAKP